MKRSLLLIFLVPAILLFSCRSDPKMKTDPDSQKIAAGDLGSESIIDIEISESNKKFRINDSMAIALVNKVPEIRQLIDYKYEDTTIYNQIYIENVPTDSDKNWHIKIVQFQPRAEHAASLIWLIVNAGNGEISVMDVPKDTVIPLDSWLKMQTRK